MLKYYTDDITTTAADFALIMTLAVNGGGLLSALMFLATTIIVFPLSQLTPHPPFKQYKGMKWMPPGRVR